MSNPKMSWKRRKFAILDDSSSSESEDQQSITSILDDSSSSSSSSSDNDSELEDPKGGQQKNDVEVINLTETMGKVTIQTTKKEDDNKKEERFFSMKKEGKIDSHIFDESDSDDSSLELLLSVRTPNKPKRRIVEKSSPSADLLAVDAGTIPQKRKDGITQKKREDHNNSTIEVWVLDRNRNEYSFSSSSSNGGNRMPKFCIPIKLHIQLFDYQRAGVSWMAGLHCQAVGGLLGDDMGMGKTYMTLSFLGGLMRARTIRNALIVAPLSVLRSWEKESSKVVNQCVPNIRTVSVSSGMNKATRVRHLKTALECSAKFPCIIITTYGLIRSSAFDFTHDDYSWDYVILDEAHNIKNPSAQVSKNCRQIASDSSTRRLILTGTPIMNNLKELWALFDFATSGKVLGPLPKFRNRFSLPIEDARSADATDHVIKIGEKANKELQEKIKPYFLQRLKIDFLADKLPPKRDFVVWTHLSKFQRAMYSRYVDSGDSAVAQVLRGITTSPLEAVTWLKKLCGHPILLERENNDKFDRMTPDDLKKKSSKLQVLDTLVERLRRMGHRTLIFSQSTRMLDIIERVLGRVRLSRIDGQTKERDRQRRVDDFNSGKDNTEVMLLSTKAAGVGLTLTGADRAIIYDPSWNPAEDSQAIDRCYRIGQRKEVAVFRFITAGSVEEKMYEKQVYKDGIRRAVMTSMGNDTTRYFDKQSLRKLFTLGEEGECEFLNKLKLHGLASSNENSPEARLTSHKGVIGVSSHDQLYNNSNKLIDLTKKDDGQTGRSNTKASDNPFSSPAAIPRRIGTSEIAQNIRRRNMTASHSEEDHHALGNSKLLERSRRLFGSSNARQSDSDQVLTAPRKAKDEFSTSKLLEMSWIPNGASERQIQREGLAVPLMDRSSTSKLYDRSQQLGGSYDQQSSREGFAASCREQQSESKLLERSKLLGKSKRVLNNDGSRTTSDKISASITIDEEKENRTQNNPMPSSEKKDTSSPQAEEIIDNNASIMRTLQRAEDARESGQHAFAMELIMDLLQNENECTFKLPKHKKLEIHKRAALIAYELQWL